MLTGHATLTATLTARPYPDLAGLSTRLTAPPAPRNAPRRFGIDHPVPLPPAVTAARQTFRSAHAGEISYYTDRQASGRPLVLLHSINAAPSVFEVKPLFEHYQGKRPVFALDLPGFGFSERGPRAYTPALYADAIVDFLTQEVGEAADVLALSLSAEFVARAAVARPALFHSLILVSPTGLGFPGAADTPDYARRRAVFDRLGKFLSFPLWSQTLYDTLTSRPSIRFYLGKNFVTKPPAACVEYAYATTHQPGARYAPLAFLSGKLFTWDIGQTLYRQVTRPTLVLYDRDPNVSFDLLPELLSQNKQWHATRIAQTLGLPHWEKLPETVAALEQFWADLVKI